MNCLRLAPPKFEQIDFGIKTKNTSESQNNTNENSQKFKFCSPKGTLLISHIFHQKTSHNNMLPRKNKETKILFLLHKLTKKLIFILFFYILTLCLSVFPFSFSRYLC